MSESSPSRGCLFAHTHQIRAQVRKHARSQANKKNKSARSQALELAHKRAGGRKPTPTPMQGGRVERGCTQLTRAVRGGDADSPTQYL